MPDAQYGGAFGAVVVRVAKIASSIPSLLPIQTIVKTSQSKTMVGRAGRAHVVDDGSTIRPLTATAVARQGNG
jgi:hypothetical protein